MRAIRSILVVMEPDQLTGPALNRTKRIAGVTQSHLHLLACEKRRDLASDLDNVAETLRNVGYSVSTRQNWHDSVHQTVIREQQLEGCGLIVKQHFPDKSLKKALLTPDDWKLLRLAPCAVLMVKTESTWTNSNVLAAIDIGNPDDEHNQLHDDILRHAFDIAEICKGQLHVLSVHPTPILNATDPAQPLGQSIAARYRQACQNFKEKYGFNDEQLHIEEGAPNLLLPQIADRLNASVTVIGTVARTGLSGVLIGNTAEVVLDALDSDVLVLKPDDIIEHLETQAGQMDE